MFVNYQEMKRILTVLLLMTGFFPMQSVGQVYLQGGYKCEGWDMFWLAKAGRPDGAPTTFSSRGRSVDFNIDIEDQITSATLEFDYYDGDFLLGIQQDYTAFDVMIDGNVIKSIEYEGNEQFKHVSVDVSSYIRSSTFTLPVVFSLNKSIAKDGAVIARTYLVINNTRAVKGTFRKDGWDMFWLAKAGSSEGAPSTFSSRGRTVDFDIDIEDQITSATLDFDYFDGDFLLGIQQDYTAFDVTVNGSVIGSVEGQGNSVFVHKSIDVTNLVKASKYTFPVVFALNASKAKDGVIIARPYLTINKGSSTAIEDGIEKMNDSQFQIFPNPTKGHVDIRFIISQPSVVGFFLYNSQGMLMKQLPKQDYSDGVYREVLDLNNLVRGVYFLHVDQDNQKTVKKIVVE